MNYYCAIDIGASSGRHIVAWMEEGEMKLEEVYRFPNGVTEQDGHLVWDIDALETHVKKGIAMAKEKYPVTSLSIDTWAVDYVLMRGNEVVKPVYAYRDSRTEAVIGKVHEIIPFETLYRKTGIQFQPFNTIYQLYEDRLSGRLDGVTEYLMIPEYFLYTLCGTKVHEYTNATTTGLVSAETGEMDEEIIKALELPAHLFTKLTKPGAKLGSYEGIDVVLCATHDTASAVEGIPMQGESLYVSSGTWSLLGVKVGRPLTDEKSRACNYSNEGGVGYTRYQKNIMGMWLVNELRRELCPEKDFAQIVREAEQSSYRKTVNADAQAFLSPASMVRAFDEALGEKITEADYFRCAYESLAQSYRRAVEELESNTKKTYEKLYIVGGGAKNALLNRLTEEATGKKVVALPIEATALGNLKMQREMES